MEGRRRPPWRRWSDGEYPNPEHRNDFTQRRLVRDPLGETKSAARKTVCKWTIAIDQFRGREKTEPLLLQCVCYGDMAERAAQALHKCDPVQVQGTLESYSGTASYGSARTYFQVLVSRFWPLSWGDEQGIPTAAATAPDGSENHG